MSAANDFVLSRRALLTAGVAVGGGLLIGFRTIADAATQASGPFHPNAFVQIDSNDVVTLTMPYVEMGQGAYTAQPQLLAEELEVPLEKIVLVAAPADEKLYGSPLFGGQITGGSGSLRGAWMTLRHAGAAARMMLIEAAATSWGVAPATCRAENGKVLHDKSGRSRRYGELVGKAALLPVPAKPVLKQTSAYKVIGKSVKRLDTPAKVNGVAKFGIDARPEGLRYAAVAASPVFNGKVASVDDSATKLVRGVSQVVKLENAVAVVADNTWAARKGLAALKITWDEGANANIDTAQMVAAADAALERPGQVANKVGDVDAAEAGAASIYEATFRMPMLAHAAMEPLNCTVHVRPDDCEIWVGSQILGRAQQDAAAAANLPLDKVVIHNLLLGGGFGRRLETDYVSQAVSFAKHIDGPVKITWSREEDIQHDYFRYHNHSRIKVGLDANGQPLSWRHRLSGPAIMLRWLPAYTKDGLDLDVVDGAVGPYEFPSVFVDFSRNEAPTGLGTGNWRGVGPTRNVFVVESAVDDLAHRAGEDPIAYRRKLLGKEPRALNVMNLAAEKAGWGQGSRPRQAQGVSVLAGFGSYLAMVAQVEVGADGQVKVQRVVCAIDCGIAVNPDTVKAQIEGGVIFGLSAVLFGKVTVSRGRVEQGNFDTYPVVRMREAPVIEVHVVESTAEPGGVGEPSTSGIFPAVTNAIFAATGKRVATLPIDPAQLRSA